MLFPEPTGPVTATSAPGGISRIDPTERRGGAAGILDRHVPEGQRRRPAPALCGRHHRSVASRHVAGSERGQPRLTGHRPRGGEQGPEPRVGGGAALQGIDELRNPVAAVDEPQEELEVGDERPHRHQPRDDAFAALPHNEDDPARHDHGVEGLEAPLHPDELQITLREAPGEAPDSLYGGTGPPEQAQHADPDQVLLQRRGQVGVRLTRLRGAAGDPAPRHVRQHHRERAPG